VLCLHEEGRSPIYQEITASCPGQIARPLPEGTNPVGVCHDEPVEKYTQMLKGFSYHVHIGLIYNLTTIELTFLNRLRNCALFSCLSDMMPVNRSAGSIS